MAYSVLVIAQPSDGVAYGVGMAVDRRGLPIARFRVTVESRGYRLE